MFIAVMSVCLSVRMNPEISKPKKKLENLDLSCRFLRFWDNDSWLQQGATPTPMPTNGHTPTLKPV